MTPSDRREFLSYAGAGVAATWLEPSAELLHPMFGEEKLSVALIGAGRQGRAILGELATIPACQLVAVCDSDDTRLQAALRRGGEAVKGYASASEMLAKEPTIAAVVIATPTHVHKDLVLQALAAKKHVYCETPLASTLDDLSAIAAAARASTQICAAGFQARSNPVYALARSFHKTGTLRELAHCRAQNHKKTSWRTAGSTPERDRELNWHLDPKLSLGLLGELGTQQL
ncbi:MAG TPA: Gfo/Idh/MocA family oxidoreductase, partial [Planctomycetota bacterium]|nr:Gfo/Idh/MocA family oxidoreductase [Planctomycetota bacterium]